MYPGQFEIVSLPSTGPDFATWTSSSLPPPTSSLPQAASASQPIRQRHGNRQAPNLVLLHDSSPPCVFSGDSRTKCMWSGAQDNRTWRLRRADAGAHPRRCSPPAPSSSRRPGAAPRSGSRSPDRASSRRSLPHLAAWRRRRLRRSGSEASRGGPPRGSARPCRTRSPSLDADASVELHLARVAGLRHSPRHQVRHADEACDEGRRRTVVDLLRLRDLLDRPSFMTAIRSDIVSASS